MNADNSITISPSNLFATALGALAPSRFPASAAVSFPPSKPSSNRLDYVDALRGLACLWVLFHHTFNAAKAHAMMGTAHGFLPARFLLHITALGGLGVSLFLALSGFCLFLPLIRKQESGKVTVNLTEFVRKRVQRLLLPYYLALSVLILLETLPVFRLSASPVGVTLGAKDVILHFLMLHNFQTDTIDSINVVFWSLALQFQLYLLFPIFVCAGRKIGITSLTVLLLALSLVWQGVIYRFASTAPHIYALLYDALPSRSFEFAAGMAAAAFVARPRPQHKRTAQTVALVLLPFGAWSAFHADLAPMLMTQTWGILFACGLVLGSGLPKQWFQRRGLAGLTFLGTISYSVVLVHWPLFRLLSPARFHLHLSGGQTVMFDFLRLLLAVGAGYLFYLIAERPFIKRDKRAFAAAAWVQWKHDNFQSPACQTFRAPGLAMADARHRRHRPAAVSNADILCSKVLRGG